MTDKINIELTKDKAIVLFEFLSRFNDQKHNDLFNDQAEQRVLWDIDCVLRNKLAEPFRSDYLDIVKRVRSAVREKKEE